MSPGAVAISELRASLLLLGTRRFGTFWVASLLSNLGTWAQQVAEPWLLLSLGASPFLIGLDSFAMSAPVWALTLVGGVLADRADRRRVIALFQSIQMLCPTLIVALLLAGAVTPWWIIALSLVVGVTDALSMPAFQSIVPTIVPRAEVARGLALNSAQFNLSRILGPALAGVLLSSVGAVACFGVSAASYVPFVGIAVWILPRVTAGAGPRPAFDRHVPWAGLGEVLQTPALRGALLTVLATSTLCSPLFTFAPVLVSDVFHGDAGHFSLAVGAFGVGGLLGAVGLLAVPAAQDRRRWSAAASQVAGLTVVTAAVLPWLGGVPVLMVVAGASMTVSSTAANALLQGSTERRLLGQAASLFMLAMRGGLSIGSLLTGLVIGPLGMRGALLADGLLAVLVSLGVARVWLRAPVPALAATPAESTSAGR